MKRDLGITGLVATSVYDNNLYDFITGDPQSGKAGLKEIKKKSIHIIWMLFFMQHY
jgi:hypothetical protein